MPGHASRQLCQPKVQRFSAVRTAARRIRRRAPDGGMPPAVRLGEILQAHRLPDRHRVQAAASRFAMVLQPIGGSDPSQANLQSTTRRVLDHQRIAALHANDEAFAGFSMGDGCGSGQNQQAQRKRHPKVAFDRTENRLALKHSPRSRSARSCSPNDAPWSLKSARAPIWQRRAGSGRW